ncbi:hypothetical protein QUV83_03575 [Cellulomonas cellasea]|uniref:hypothetical protein n=1 Tax=Cellulomonas cellasea TaxID=43670 RepID=UPI0025A33168|nr:hypothetical protein [Cellulomonas cellasea]MDM8083845.1 hypothetical protein [Cellulomonas cellasea]
MRWEALFADLEAQFAAQSAAELDAQVAELTRAERATVVISDRLRDALGAHLSVRLRGGTVAEGRVLDAAPQWLLLGAHGRQALIPLAAVVVVAGLTRSVAPGPGVVEGRLTLGHALRALARDRVLVQVEVDGAELTGRIERVGADHLDLSVGHGEVARRGGLVAVPFAALCAVRSR